MKDAHIISLRYKMDNVKEKIEGKILAVRDDGFGFISSKEIPFEKIFFHWSALKQNTKKFLDLKVGDKVRFTPVKLIDRGWRAHGIEVIPDEE